MTDTATQGRDAAGEAGAASAVIQITDLVALAAAAHPLRRRLLDLFDVEGQVTPAALARRTGQPVGNITRHLRELAQAGLAEEIQGKPGEASERAWRRTAGYRIVTSEMPADSVSRAVILAAHSVTTQRHSQLAQAWLSARETFPPGWEGSGFLTDRWLRLCPAEIAQLREEVSELFERWADREVPDDGMDRAPVIVLAQALRSEP
jgi:helix-turn-helix protein